MKELKTGLTATVSETVLYTNTASALGSKLLALCDTGYGRTDGKSRRSAYSAFSRGNGRQTVASK